MPVNDNLTEYAPPYSPELVPKVLTILSEHMGRLSESLRKPLSISIDELNMSIEVQLGINVQDSECERAFTLLKAVPETSSEFLRRYSLFMLCIDRLEGEVDQRLEELNKELSALSLSLNNTIKDILSKLGSAGRALMSIYLGFQTKLTQELTT